MGTYIHVCVASGTNKYFWPQPLVLCRVDTGEPWGGGDVCILIDACLLACKVCSVVGATVAEPCAMKWTENDFYGESLCHTN